MKKKIRVVQFGVSHEHANGKLETLRFLSDDFEIAGVVDDRAHTTPRWPLRRPDSLVEGLPLLTEEQVWADKTIDAAFVEVTNCELVETARRVLDHGLPMHLDKPGGESYEPFASLRKEAKARGLPLQMGYMFRANPAIRWLIDAVRKGWFGDIFEIEASMDHGYGDDDYRRYLGSFRAGILYNLCCHLVDFVVSMLGEPVAASQAICTAPGSPADSRDNCAATLQYASGALVHLRSCGRMVGQIRRRLRVCGTLGWAELCPIERFDGQPLLLEVQFRESAGGIPAGAVQTLDFGSQGRVSNVDRYAAQLREFARQVRGEEREPDDLCEHDLAVQRTLLKMCGLNDGFGVRSSAG